MIRSLKTLRKVMMSQREFQAMGTRAEPTGLAAATTIQQPELDLFPLEAAKTGGADSCALPKTSMAAH
jgi:hypothetical protein